MGFIFPSGFRTAAALRDMIKKYTLQNNMTTVLETIALNCFKHTVLETESIFNRCKDKNFKT
jgi:hypothetical protein